MRKKLFVIMLGVRGFPHVQGGVESHAEHLSVSLVELGCEVEVIVRSIYQDKKIGNSWRNVKFCRIWAPRSKMLEAIVHTFCGVLYAAIKRPDILHIQAIGPALMTPLARILGLRVVVTHHGQDYERQKWGIVAKSVLRVGEFFGMRFSNGRIVISNVIRKLVIQKHHCASVLIPNGVHLPEIPETKNALERFNLDKGRYVLLVSRLVPEKRHHDLIRAFLLSALAGWKLVLVGAADHADSYARSVLEAAKSTNSIVYTGFQSGTALSELYAHAGVFVLPSSHEGLPIALLEALSFGLPVIASDIPANREIECSEINYFTLGDVFALAELLKAQAFVEYEDKFRQKVRALVEEKYRWSVIAQKTYEVYASVRQKLVLSDELS